MTDPACGEELLAVSFESPPEQASRRRFAWLAGATLAVAVMTAVVLGIDLPGLSRGASSAKSSGATAVQRRDLVATDTEAGTLSYANPRTVFNRQSGTITWLPRLGDLVKPGQRLYQVDGSPVILMDGTFPAYRDLSSGVTDGPDVQQLKRNLVSLGFDPGHAITINQTFDSATTDAVERWQASLGQDQTGTVKLGQVVFLPGPQRVTAVDAALGGTGGSGAGNAAASSGASGTTGSTASGSPASGGTSSTAGTSSAGSSSPAGGSSSSSSGTATTPSSSGSASSGAGTGTSAPMLAPRPQFVKQMIPDSTATVGDARSNDATASACPNGAGGATSVDAAHSCQAAGGNKAKGGSQTLGALLALLKAETAELQRANTSSGPSGGGGAAASSGRGSAGSSGGLSGGGGGGVSSGASTSGAATSQAVLETTSTQVVVTVDLDATKQSEAVVGEPVSVQMPNGSVKNGKITLVSPVAQRSSSSATGGAGSTSSGTPSSTVPVTISVSGRLPTTGLDQAAVSVNFEQQVERNVLSVPVTALLATPGGGYAVQEAAPGHRLIAVTPGLFAAGYVQVSGAQIYPGLQVTDSQG